MSDRTLCENRKRLSPDHLPGRRYEMLHLKKAGESLKLCEKDMGI